MRVNALLPDKKSLRLDGVRMDDENRLVEVVVRSIAQRACCPKCEGSSSRVHSHYSRRLADLPWQGLSVVLHWKTRRFFCTDAECPQKIFTERLPQVAASSSRRTDRLAVAVRSIALACGGECGSRLANRLGMKISPDSLLRETRRVALPKMPVPRVLGVDDWAFRKGQRYGTVLIDLERGNPVDLLPDRHAESLKKWLTEHPEVEIISRDRGDCYIKGATEGAPHATQVADRFHLAKNLREALFRLIERRSAQVRSAIEQTHNQKLVETQTKPTRSVVDSGDDQSERPASRARQRRHQLYQSVKQLHEQGVSLRGIARHLGIHRSSVRRFVQADGFPERAVRQYPSTTDPVIDFLRKRWNEGCQNARQLTREIQQQDFSISYDSVRRRVSKWRTASVRARRNVQRPPPRPSSRRLSWLLLKDDGELSEKERSLKESVLSQCSMISDGVRTATEFQELFRQGVGKRLSRWLTRAAQKSVPSELRRFAFGIKRDAAAVRAAITLPWSNGPVEGQVNRLKTLKRQMYGRGNFDLLKLRFLSPQ